MKYKLTCINQTIQIVALLTFFLEKNTTKPLHEVNTVYLRVLNQTKTAKNRYTNSKSSQKQSFLRKITRFSRKMFTRLNIIIYPSK